MERADEDIQVGRVVDDLGFGRELRRWPLGRPPFAKLGDRPCLLPHRIVVPPVDDRRLRRPRGGDGGRRISMRIGALKGERDGGEERQPEKHERPGVEVSPLDDWTSKRVVSAGSATRGVLAARRRPCDRSDVTPCTRAEVPHAAYPGSLTVARPRYRPGLRHEQTV